MNSEDLIAELRRWAGWRRDLLQRECDDFNLRYKLGTPGWLNMDSGERKATHTTSRAQVLSGHSAVVWVKGVSGCYLLDRFEPANPVEVPDEI